jgi:hypothetical protein
MNDKLNEYRLQKYKESLNSAWGFNDYNDWPIKFNSIMHLFLQEFAEEFIRDLSDLQKKGVEKKDIARAFYNPARLYRIIHSVIFGMRMKRMPVQTQRDMAVYMLDLVKLLKEGSEFNEHGLNLIMSSQQIQAIEMTPVTDSREPMAIQGLCGMLWAYTEAIFFRAHDVTKEIHGMYRLQDGNQLLVREYLNLNCTELWEGYPLISNNSIKIFIKYNKNLRLDIDSYNHLFLKEGNYVKDFEEYRIEVDGKRVGIEEVTVLTPVLQQAVEIIYSWSKIVHWREIANKYADIYWFRKRPLPIMLNKEWRTPPYLREKILNGEISKKRLDTLTDESIARLISLVI